LEVGFGSPYLYDINVVFFINENKYHLKKDGVEYIFIYHSMKVDSTIFSARQMKRLVNTNKRYVLIIVREKYGKTHYYFQGCDPSHKDEIIDVMSNYDYIF
jgi:hypothetical protein